MSKKIKIILNKTEEKIGIKGRVIHVNSGYAFNYLLPQKIAELATPGKLKHLTMFKKIQQQQLEISKINAKIILSNLEIIAKVSLKKKIGDNTKIFGRIQKKEISGKILKYTGYQLDKQQITMSEIKQSGIYQAKLNILSDIGSFLKIQIIPEINNNNL
uniref:50S ribosomal protein L9, chloroplastic n=1 Tax=Eucheuma denticulatum TaxID=305493 RepID=A0A8E7UEJ0_9FLOR|nr:50S ribosomal protein L9 [Eucheuma denticulatum]